MPKPLNSSEVLSEINPPVYLRPISAEDYGLLCKWNFDPEVTRYFEKRPVFDETKQREWFRLLLLSTDRIKKIVMLNKDTAIGMVSLMRIDLSSRQAEIGITIGETAYQGKGLAATAMRLMMHTAKNELGLEKLYLYVLKENERALRLFTKLGFSLKNSPVSKTITDYGEQEKITMEIVL